MHIKAKVVMEKTKAEATLAAIRELPEYDGTLPNFIMPSASPIFIQHGKYASHHHILGIPRPVSVVPNTIVEIYRKTGVISVDDVSRSWFYIEPTKGDDDTYVNVFVGYLGPIGHEHMLGFNITAWPESITTTDAGEVVLWCTSIADVDEGYIEALCVTRLDVEGDVKPFQECSELIQEFSNLINDFDQEVDKLDVIGNWLDSQSKPKLKVKLKNAEHYALSALGFDLQFNSILHYGDYVRMPSGIIYVRVRLSPR